MKAVLVQAPCWVICSPPYNLALLKAVCEKQGHDIVCLDFNIKFYKYLAKRKEQYIYDSPTDWYNETYVKEIIRDYPEFIDECVEEIFKFSCRAIGFTITGLSRFFSEEIAKRIKLKDKEKTIIFGGSHCFKIELGEKLLHNCPYIDVMCYLEGEEVLPRLLNMIEKNDKIEYLPGIAFRKEDNEIIKSPDIELVKDLDYLPFADYSDFNLDEYSLRELPISTSRGCINRCAFCSESRIWRKYRFRSSENIYKEIKHQISRYPLIKLFFFNSSLINGNIEVLDELCDLLIKNKIDIHWGGQATIREEMTKEFILKMKRAGFSYVSYGLESASPQILKKIGKSFTPELAERVIRHTKKARIRTDVNIIVGFPTETNNDIVRTANFLKRNKAFIDEVFFHPLVVSCGSYYYENKNKWGIKFENELNPNSWYSTKEENNLDKRLEILKFYKSYIGNKGESFFTLGDYYLSIADVNFNKGDYKNALICYKKAKELNENRLKDEFIKEKIGLAQRKTLI